MLDLLLALAVQTSTAPADLVDVPSMHPSYRVDIRYATADNFFGRKVYPEARCILIRPAAEALERARTWLETHHPELHLLLKDCYRPDPVQAVLWDAVKGTPKARYVANPHTRTGSIHAYGAAVDLTLAEADGEELDMGTPYDHLGPLAEPRHEARYLREGKLNAEQLRNRKILRQAMRQAGFVGLRNEWWHFNLGTSKQVRARYRRLSVPFSAVPRVSRP